MNTPRETIYNTLFENLQVALSSFSFQTFSRRILPWDKVPYELQPALFQTQVSETATIGGRGMPAVWLLKVDVTLYVNPGNNPDFIPSSFLNPAVDAIEKLLPGTGPQYQTFGLAGVSEIRINGEVIYYEGVLDQQAVAVVPIHIVAV